MKYFVGGIAGVPGGAYGWTATDGSGGPDVETNSGAFPPSTEDQRGRARGGGCAARGKNAREQLDTLAKSGRGRGRLFRPGW